MAVPLWGFTPSVSADPVSTLGISVSGPDLGPLLILALLSPAESGRQGREISIRNDIGQALWG
jgi:hypothetical protein